MAAPPEHLSELLNEFPEVGTAFAYGSAVFPQSGYTEQQIKASMTDLIFCVDDPMAWHQENLRRHPAHYSTLQLLGPAAITAVQERVGAGVYYNTLVRVRGRLIKYGVTSRLTLHDDLLHWRSLYLSGRMHKPVLFLKPPCSEFMSAARANLRGALAAALLLLPSRFQETELLGSICGISYAGDVRMGVGESWGKVSSIVQGQHGALTSLYAGTIAELQQESPGILTADGSVGARAGFSSFEQDLGLEARCKVLELLPSNARRELFTRLSPNYAALPSAWQTRDAALAPPPSAELRSAVEGIWRQSAGTDDANLRLADAMRGSLSKIVRRASVGQTLKGVLTAGGAKAGRYAFNKIAKRIRAG